MDITRRFGRPQEVTTDRGRAFFSELFMKTCQGLFIKYKPIATDQAQADGMVERVNKTLTDIASITSKGEGATWANYVGEIEYAINTRVSSVTKFSPYELVYGRLPPGPTYTEVLQPDELKTAPQQLRVLRNRINILQQMAHKNQMEAAGRQWNYYNAHAQAHHFEEGDLVYYYKPSSAERGITSKLAYKWTGPYRITKQIGDVTFVLKNEKENKELPGTAHARQLYKPIKL